MPEPVVIIGPAAGPAGPVVPGRAIGEPRRNEAEPDAAPEKAAGPSLGAAHLGVRPLALAPRGQGPCHRDRLSGPRVSPALDRRRRLVGHPGRDPLFAVRLRDAEWRDKRDLRKRVHSSHGLENAGQRAGIGGRGRAGAAPKSGLPTPSTTSSRSRSGSKPPAAEPQREQEPPQNDTGRSDGPPVPRSPNQLPQELAAAIWPVAQTGAEPTKATLAAPYPRSDASGPCLEPGSQPGRRCRHPRMTSAKATLLADASAAGPGGRSGRQDQGDARKFPPISSCPRPRRNQAADRRQPRPQKPGRRPSRPRRARKASRPSEPKKAADSADKPVEPSRTSAAEPTHRCPSRLAQPRRLARTAGSQAGHGDARPAPPGS